jgi:formate dehydrogenase subunit gamma
LLADRKLAWGQTSADGAITIEPVYCLGLCAVAPAALIDGEPLGRADAARLIAAVREGAS